MYLEDELYIKEAIEFAKKHQDQLNKNHPAQGILSKKMSDFYELKLGKF
jgi:hypothetical protein